MDVALSAFLATCGEPFAIEQTQWGEMALEMRSYFSDAPPPTASISSARAVVCKEDSVLVVQSGDEAFHVVPGGRREGNETVEETVRREVLEETGWALWELSYLSFAHFHHLTPKPKGYPYPYPDFCWVYFWGLAGEYRPKSKLPDTILQNKYVLDSQFVPFDKARIMLSDGSQCRLLEKVVTLVDVERIS